MGPEPLAIDFDPLQTLGFLRVDWIEAHCRVPGGVYEGEPLVFNGWQLFCSVNHHRIRSDAVVDPRRVLQPFAYRRSVVVGPQKALAVDTPVPTPSGWSTIGDLSVGDFVFTEAGKRTAVLAKSDVFRDDTYRVSFSDGSSLVACGEHEWWVERRTPSSTYVADRLTTRQMLDVGLVDRQGARIFRVPVTQPLTLPAADLPVPPYTLGAWLGDGDSDAGRLTGIDIEVFERVASDGFEVRQQASVARWGVVGLLPLLREAGVLRNKHIPAAYLRASEGQRWALLQGLMDTDGSADARQGKCEFTTTSPALRDGVGELLHSLGVKHVTYEGVARIAGRVTGPKWRLSFAARSDMPVFALPRKQGRLKAPGCAHAQFKHRRVVSIERIADVPTQCITVDSEAHVFLAGREMIPTGNCGKSPWGAGELLCDAVGPSLFAGWASEGDVYRCSDHGCPCGWEYWYEPGEAMGVPRGKSLIGLLAFAEDQTQNVYEPMQTMVASGPLAEQIKVREGFLRLPNRGMILPLTAAAKSKLGRPLTGALGDESGLYTKSNRVLDTWQTIRRGVAGMQGRTIELTNPWDPMENSAAQQAFESRRPDIFRYYRTPPADLDYRKKRDRERIHLYVYADSPWVDTRSAIDPEASELVETDPTQAERFFGNRLVQGLGAFMTEALWQGATADVEPGARICLGFDGSKSGDWTAIRAETIDGHRFTPTYGPDDRPTIWNPAEWGGSIPRGEVLTAVAELFERFEVERFYVDIDPIWSTQMEDWAREYTDDIVIGFKTATIDRIYGALVRYREDLSEGLTTHDDCAITRTHALNARKVAKSGDRFVLGKPSEHQKIDAVMADVLAHQAACDARAVGWAEVAGPAYFRLPR